MSTFTQEDPKVTNEDCKKYLSNLFYEFSPDSFKRVNKFISNKGMVVREFRHSEMCNMYVIENFMGILSISRDRPQLRENRKR